MRTYDTKLWRSDGFFFLSWKQTRTKCHVTHLRIKIDKTKSTRNAFNFRCFHLSCWLVFIISPKCLTMKMNKSNRNLRNVLIGLINSGQKTIAIGSSHYVCVWSAFRKIASQILVSTLSVFVKCSQCKTTVTMRQHIFQWDFFCFSKCVRC